MKKDEGIKPECRDEAWRAYRALNDSPLQQKLRAAHTCDVGIVHWNPQVEDPDSVLETLRQMKSIGFTYVRFHCIGPYDFHCGASSDTPDFSVSDMYLDKAHEAGLLAYPHFGFSKLHPDILQKVGLTKEDAVSLGPNDERVQEYLRLKIRPIVERYRNHPALGAWPTKGEPNSNSIPLQNDMEKKRFIQWLQARHSSPDALNQAWSIYPRKRKPLIAAWQDAVRILDGVKIDTRSILATTECPRHELFGALHDLFRFRADEAADWIRREVAIIRESDTEHPTLIGNHQFFINNPQLGWDIFQWGRLGDCHFSSIHMSWHLEQVAGEQDRPVYMTARMTKDAFKGGLTSAYETTGGPCQYSGGYGNHMDADLMRKLMFSYLAAGNQNIAFWCWKPRPGGIESGEFGMVSLSGRITEWAEEAGKISRHMQAYAKEIWEAVEEPELALLRSWDTEAICLCEPARHDLKDGVTDWSSGSGQQHIRALIGASRTAINHRLAFEYVTEEELLEGIACCYPAIYMPHVRACSQQLLEKLLEYVESGGRLVADVQLAFCDQWGKLRERGENTILDRLFGGWIDNIHDARTRPRSVDGIPIQNFYGDLVTTHASIIKTFHDGRPAASEAVIGRGQAVLLAFDPARECWKPGNEAMETLLGCIMRGRLPQRWTSNHPLTFRRSAPNADHWFLINDGETRAVTITVPNGFSKAVDVMTGETVLKGEAIRAQLPAYSGLWLRSES